MSYYLPTGMKANIDEVEGGGEGSRKVGGIYGVCKNLLCWEMFRETNAFQIRKLWQLNIGLGGGRQNGNRGGLGNEMRRKRRMRRRRRRRRKRGRRRRRRRRRRRKRRRKMRRRKRSKKKRRRKRREKCEFVGCL